MTAPADQSSAAPLAAIILAAGKGTRMNSDLPKVAHAVAGRAMVWWVVEAVRKAGAEKIVLVVGHGADSVKAVFDGDDDDIEYALQAEQHGTGHATRCAATALSAWPGNVLVLAGDGPLIRAETIEKILAHHRDTDAVVTLATSVIGDPTGYGRIIRDEAGRFVAIVEHKNATDAQRAIHEVNPSYACFRADALFDALDALEPDPLSGEEYVTDVPKMIGDAGGIVELLAAVPPEDILSINTVEQLLEVERILKRREEVAAP